MYREVSSRCFSFGAVLGFTALFNFGLLHGWVRPLGCVLGCVVESQCPGPVHEQSLLGKLCGLKASKWKAATTVEASSNKYIRSLKRSPKPDDITRRFDGFGLRAYSSRSLDLNKHPKVMKQYANQDISTYHTRHRGNCS